MKMHIKSIKCSVGTGAGVLCSHPWEKMNVLRKTFLWLFPHLFWVEAQSSPERPGDEAVIVTC